MEEKWKVFEEATLNSAKEVCVCVARGRLVVEEEKMAVNDDRMK